MILSGLWYGKDPDCSMFFKHFIDELEEINNEKPLVVNDSNDRLNVRAIMLSADSPAKAKVLNCLSFNGYYSCPYCLHPGKIHSKTVRYPYMKSVTQRTHADVLADAMEIVHMRQNGHKLDNIRGIKGPTPLFLLFSFDIVRGIPVDYMHACLHGIVCKLLSLWLDPENHKQGYYIGRPTLEAIDERLLKIRHLVCSRGIHGLLAIDATTKRLSTYIGCISMGRPVWTIFYPICTFGTSSFFRVPFIS